MLNTPTDVYQISAPGGSTKVDTLGIYTDLIINTYYLVLPFVNGENRNVFFLFFVDGANMLSMQIFNVHVEYISSPSKFSPTSTS